MSTEITHSGYVAIVGRPNVGKSTLLNHLLGQKISITSRRPQTTRHQILGVHTTDTAQVVYIDTPGIHQSEQRAMNRYLNRAASTVLQDVDLVLFMVEGTRWTEEDDLVLRRLEKLTIPVLLVVNKIDMIEDKAKLLPHLEKLGRRRDFAETIPISARHQDDAARVQETVLRYLPEGGPFFPEDQITNRSSRFLAAEIIREKLTRQLNQELPYALTVEIESFKEEEEGRLTIHGLIWVERAGQKGIVIGKGGSVLKKVGEQARLDMQKLFEAKVFLQLWVKVKEGWSDDERALRSLGYDET